MKFKNKNLESNNFFGANLITIILCWKSNFKLIAHLENIHGRKYHLVRSSNSSRYYQQ